MVVIWKLVRKLLFTLLLPTADLQEESGREMRGGTMVFILFYFMLFFSRLDGQVESA